MTAPLPFDRIRLLTEMGRELSIDEFLELPLHQRVQHVLARTVEFRNGREVVPRLVALQSMRQHELEK